MSNLFKNILAFLSRNRSMAIYAFASMCTTGIDMLLSYILESFTVVLVANAIGATTGFLLHYYFVSERVFGGRNMRTFIIFLITFILGLILAEIMIWFFRHILFSGSELFIHFFISKAMSMIISFFITYYLRQRFI